MSGQQPTTGDQRAFSIKTRRPIDEDALLTAEDREAKQQRPAGDGSDCTTRRRACKNCVCGRAEEEAKAAAGQATGVPAAPTATATTEAIPSAPPAGGCGNCSRGDAFRCGGCPYAGKPAWNTSETGAIKLSLADDI